MSFVDVRFADQDPSDLEFIVSSEYTPTDTGRFQVISPEEARGLYFPGEKGKTNVYVITGGQKGDEGKGGAVEVVRKADPSITWVAAEDSTHNAGKGAHAIDEDGNEVDINFHLCPSTSADPDISNLVGRNTQMNPFTLEQEITGIYNKTGRTELGVDYHLTVDLKTNLVVPTNRADDVICRDDTMASTVSGATSSAMYAAGKKAPTLEHVLYDKVRFFKLVNAQIKEFNDRIAHDSVLRDIGIYNRITLGSALRTPKVYNSVPRLKVLHDKLSPGELKFFSRVNAAEFLWGEYKRIADANLFFVGDTIEEKNERVARGEPGVLEGVQSVPLSGPCKFGINKTAAGTHSAQTIANAGLDDSVVNHYKVLIFKFGNTSVGGKDKTMSGLIRQDALSKLSATKEGVEYTFEKTASLDAFLTKDEITSAFHEVTAAYFGAIEKGQSLQDSKVYISGIDCEFSLVEAKTLLTAYVWGETGVTSGRARITRNADNVESGQVYKFERKSLQHRNAGDRALDVPLVGVVTAYKVNGDYPGYKSGDVITPGMPLREEHLTVKGCIPIMDLLPSWDSLNEDGTNDLKPGDILHPNWGNYLAKVSGGNTVISVGAGPKTSKKYFVKKVA
jgi:hypothetical protein